MKAQDFHRLCDNQGGTLTLMQVQGTGFLFCAYWNGTWTGAGSYKSDGMAACNAPGLILTCEPMCHSSNVHVHVCVQESRFWVH